MGRNKVVMKSLAELIKVKNLELESLYCILMPVLAYTYKDAFDRLFEGHI